MEIQGDLDSAIDVAQPTFGPKFDSKLNSKFELSGQNKKNNY